MGTQNILALLQFGLLVTVAARAQTTLAYSVAAEGSATLHRAQVDTSPGNVYIYVGGSFLIGTRPTELQFLFYFTLAGNTTGYLTPLLFERVTGELVTSYVVRGIGKGISVNMNPLPSTIPFEIIEGLKESTNGNFTFGFVNALVDASGNQLASSPGTVDMDNPADSGTGVGGTGTTNDWAVTNLSPYPAVAVGTTFGVSGTDYSFYLPRRTYSAIALGLAAD